MKTKKVAKAIFSKLPGLRVQTSIIDALQHNVTESATDRDLDLLEQLFASIETRQVHLEDRIRKIKLSRLGHIQRGETPIQVSIMDAVAPWQSMVVDPVSTPGMILEEETRYYEYVGGLYEGRGEAIEVGPWLGKSTQHIMRGLSRNAKFANRQLHVFDDFTWRSEWMDQYVELAERLPNHANFQHLFESHTREIRPRLKVTKGKLVNYDGNDELPPIDWHGAPIEIMYIDCGRHLLVNEAWYRIFSPAFIPNFSLIVMQDWRTHRDRPRCFYNETLCFTEAHPELRLVHEVSNGGIAAFLYCGR